MKLLLSADPATGQLFILSFEPNCVFRVAPKHNWEWTLEFLFGSVPTTEEQIEIETVALRMLRDGK